MSHILCSISKISTFEAAPYVAAAPRDATGGVWAYPVGTDAWGDRAWSSSKVGQAVFYSCTCSQLCVYPNTSPCLPSQTNANSISLSSCPWACWCVVRLPQDTREPRQVAPGPWQGFVSVLLTGDKRCPTLTETENCVPKSLSPFPHRSCVSLGFAQWQDGIPLSSVKSFFPAFLVFPQSRGNWHLFWMVCSWVTSQWGPTVENMVCRGLTHH